MSSRRCALIGAALAAVILPLAACGGASTPSSSTPTTTHHAAAPAFPANVQNCGEQVEIAKEPKRILTMGYESVELINAAGGADRIVATFDNTKDRDSPAFKAVTSPELASDEEPNTENVVALRPDLVVSYGLFDVNLASLQQAGAASLIVSGLCGQHGGGQGDGAQFTDIYDDIETYGQLFGTQPQAQAAVEQLKQRVAAVKKDTSGKTAAHGYFFGTTFSTSGNQSMVQSQLDALGLKNIFSDVAKDFIEANTEELIKRDPQVMILTHYLPDETFEQAKAKFLALPGAQDMQAVRNNQIISLPYSQTQASVSAVIGLETIAKGLQTIPK
ncbi:MAG: ABC transporter substrate-binding protein [Pseudonocardiaceae bacterium]